MGLRPPSSASVPMVTTSVVPPVGLRQSVNETTMGTALATPGVDSAANFSRTLIGCASSKFLVP